MNRIRPSRAPSPKASKHHGPRASDPESSSHRASLSPDEAAAAPADILAAGKGRHAEQAGPAFPAHSSVTEEAVEQRLGDWLRRKDAGALSENCVEKDFNALRKQHYNEFAMLKKLKEQQLTEEEEEVEEEEEEESE